MSARDEIKTLMEAAVASFNNGDPTAFVNLLDVTSKCSITLRFASTARRTFLAWFQSELAGAKTSTDRWNQPTYRA